MSNDGDASNRLSAAIDQILSRSRSGEAEADAGRTDAADEPAARHDDTYEMPEIVPATEEPPPVAPTLPARVTVPSRAPTPAPAPAPAPAPIPTAAPTPAAPVTLWSDHLVPSNSRGAGLRAPGRKPRVRRVTRVLRHIDPWSTFKVALLFSLVTYLVALTSGVLLWRVADSTGTLDNVERWFTQFGWETFELKGGEIFHNAWIIGLFGVVAMTGGLVLLATVFNLVSDIIGGVRMTVLEEEVVERTVSSTRRYVVRQGAAAAGAAAAAVPQWDVDDDPDDDDPDDDDHDDDDPDDGNPARHAPIHSPSTAEPVAATADWSVDDD